MSSCSKCQGGTEKIARAGEAVFWFCRPCQLPHDEHGNALFEAQGLNPRYNPLVAARERLKPHLKGMSAPGKTSLEVALIKTIQEAYFEGIKEGVLLAYSQDREEGVPMEKVGVSQEELVRELKEEYGQIKARLNNSDSLTKEASAELQQRLSAVKEKLDSLQT